MYFNNSIALWFLLLLIPFLILVVKKLTNVYYLEKNNGYKFFIKNSSLPNFFTRILVNSIIIFIFVLIILAIANPIVSVQDNSTIYKNIRIFFIVDVSKSMLWAEDLFPNRITVVKDELKKFYLSLKDKYEVSIIPFAGTPNLYYCPLTYSSKVILPLIDNLSYESAPSAGTDLSAAVVGFKNILEKDNLHKDGINLVVLFSDGGREESDATNKKDLFNALSNLSNCKFYTIGVGKNTKTPLIIRDEDGKFISYWKDEQFNIYYSLLDESFLKNISKRGNGEYMPLNTSNSLENFLGEAIQKNSVPDVGEIRYKRVRVAPFLLAFSAIILGFLFFFFLRRN